MLADYGEEQPAGPRRYLTRVLDAMATARRSDLPKLFPVQQTLRATPKSRASCT